MNEMTPQNFRRGIFIALATAVCFGVYPAANRAVYACGGSTTFVILVTTWVRALALAFFSLAAGERLFATRKDLKESSVGGFFQAISVFGIISALAYLPGPVVIIIVFTHTLMLLFFMAWRGEIKLNTATVLTTIVALAGLSLVLDPWHVQSKTSLTGMALAFAAAVATVSRLYVYGHQTKARYPTVVGAENFLIAAILIIPSLFFTPIQLPTSMAGYFWLAASAASLSIGSFGMFYGISLLGSFRWSLFAKLEPVFTSLFSVLFLGEILKAQQYIGILVVVSSLAFFQIFEQRRMKKA